MTNPTPEEEAVARALARRAGHDPDAPLFVDAGTGAVIPIWQHFLEEARAAVEALVELAAAS